MPYIIATEKRGKNLRKKQKTYLIMASSMKKNNLALTLFLALLWANFVSLSKGVDTANDILVQGTSMSPSSVASMPCLKILIPCQMYLKPTTKPPPPPPSCCVSIKEVLSDDAKCLCDIFNSADVLVSLNITQDDALKLPKACGAKVDVSVCKRDATINTPSTASGNSSSSSSNSASTINPANGVSYLAGSGFAAGFLSVIVTLF